ncbi:MAG: helix-turn-helix domain-containing protein [Candidatus Rokubacteria bacterium]|nr:helix-turn-helix domain-containing protein [Candidatus Rokubacteria bacterium]
MYLGDGTISRHKGSHILRVFLSGDQYDVIERVVTAITTVMPSRAVTKYPRRGQNSIELSCYWHHWPLLFPQHGPGRKHQRAIILDVWQIQIVTKHAADFLRGCIDSDGCRHRRVVNGKNYPAYSFSNRSGDIHRLFHWACGLVGIRPRRATATTTSVARRADVARLDALIGYAPKS